jgi:hypothetical protein
MRRGALDLPDLQAWKRMRPLNVNDTERMAKPEQHSFSSLDQSTIKRLAEPRVSSGSRGPKPLLCFNTAVSPLPVTATGTRLVLDA